MKPTAEASHNKLFITLRNCLALQNYIYCLCINHYFGVVDISPFDRPFHFLCFISSALDSVKCDLSCGGGYCLVRDNGEQTCVCNHGYVQVVISPLNECISE